MSTKLKYKYKNGGRLLIIGGILFLCLIIVFFFRFQQKTQIEVEAQTQIHLKEISQQVSDTIKMEMEYCIREVQLLTAMVENLNRPIDESIVPMLKDVAYKSKVNRFAIVTKDQRVYHSSNTVQTTASNYRYVEDVFQGKSGFSEIFTSTATGETVISIYQPVYKDGEVVVGVFGTIVVSDLEDMVQFSGFQNEGYSYLIQKNGDIIMWTKHPNRVQGHDNYFKFLDETAQDGSITAEKLEEDIKEREDGRFSYTAGEEKRKAYYQPVGFSDWYLISIVPQEVFDTYKTDLSDLAVGLTIKMLIICLILIGLIIFWMKGNGDHLKQVYYETLNSNKKYEMAMVHAKFHIFEYNVGKQCFVELSDAIKSIFYQGEENEGEESRISYEMFEESSQKQLKELMHKGVHENELVKKEIRKKDGTWIDLTVTAFKQLDGMHLIGVAEDITQVKELETQYIQEEQYCHAMLGEAILGFSMDLETRKISTAFQKGKATELLSEETYFDEGLLEEICKDIHPEYRKNITKIYNIRELRRVHQLGVKEISEYFMLRLPDTQEYIWASTVIHFLKSSADGRAIIFAYMKNVNDKKKRELELEYQSERDGLTGLYNRITFVKKVEATLEEWDKKDCSALLMTDLDGFKRINDTLGHQAGDELLKKVGSTFNEILDKHQYVGRLGGDEFILFLHGFTSEKQITEIAEKICRKVENISMEGCEDLIFTISIGVAFAEENDTFEELYKNADDSLYEAKKSGKNRFCVFS